MITKEEKYSALKRLGQELHIPIPEAFWALEVFDKDGNPICPHCSFPAISDKCPNCGQDVKFKQRSHSWTRNAYNLLFCQLDSKNGSDSTFGGGKLSCKDTSGAIKYGAKPIGIVTALSLDVTNATHGILTPAGQDTKGIVVGSGTDAESFEDYKLQTQIANGTGAGQLSYIASELHSVSYNEVSKILSDAQIRYFNNNSGGDVSVNEVGIYCGLESAICCTARDRLASTVTVPNTGQLKVTYTIQLTYPA